MTVCQCVNLFSGVALAFIATSLFQAVQLTRCRVPCSLTTCRVTTLSGLRQPAAHTYLSGNYSLL